MKVIDAHVHIYERICGYGGRGELRAVGNGVARWANGDLHTLIPEGMGSTGFSAERLLKLLDQHHIDKAVILQGNLYGFQNGYIQEAIARYPDRLTGACAVDPFARHGQEILRHLLEENGYKAVKFEFSDKFGLMSFHRPFALDGDVMTPYYQCIAERGATLVVDIGAMGMDSYQPDAIANIARQYGDMRIVVCHLLAHHCGEAEILAAELDKLKLPNVWFDLSGLPWNTAPDPYPFLTACEYAGLAKQIVGSEKLLWGSDAPGVAVKISYRELLDYLLYSDVFSQEERKRVFTLNALQAYDFA